MSSGWAPGLGQSGHSRVTAVRSSRTAGLADYLPPSEKHEAKLLEPMADEAERLAEQGMRASGKVAIRWS